MKRRGAIDSRVWAVLAACLSFGVVGGLGFWTVGLLRARGRRLDQRANHTARLTASGSTLAMATSALPSEMSDRDSDNAGPIDPASPRGAKNPRSVYPGWWVAVGACLSLGVVSGLGFWAFGLFVEPLGNEFGWSKTTLAGTVSMSMLVSGLASPLVGRLVDRFRPRRIILIGTLVSVVAYLLLAGVQELWQFLALSAILAFFRAWIFYVPFTTIITRWFSTNRATAMGIATSGFGIGGLLFLPLTSELLELFGWRATFAATGLLVLFVIGVFGALVHNDPPVRWAAHEAAPALVAGAPSEAHLPRFDTLRQIYRSPIFWLLATGFSLFYFAQWAFLFHGPQAMQSGGLSAREAALALAATGGLGVLVRLSTGAVLARLVRIEYVAVGVLGSMAVALGILATGTSMVNMLLFVVLWGVGSGLGPALEPMLVSRLFSRRHYASVYGALDGIETAVSFPGPWLGGIAYELGHSYAPALGLYAGALVLGAAIFGLMPRALRRGRVAIASVPRLRAAFAH
jgi:predicted MFS family arabinose efflux permease